MTTATGGRSLRTWRTSIGAPARLRRWPSPGLWGSALIVALVCAIPPVYLLVRVTESPTAAWDVVATSETLRLVFRTALLAAAVTVLAAAIAVPLAWLTTRTDLPARRPLGVVAALPLAVPSYIAAMVTISAFGPRGLLQDALSPLGVERLPSIYGFWGATLVLALFTYPYLYLTLRPVIAGLDPRLEELSRGLGYGRWTTFRRIVLPQLRPALGAGGLLIALYAISDFGAVSLLRYESLSWVVYSRYESSFDFTGAAALSLVLIGFALAIVALEVWWRGARRYDSARARGRTAPPSPLGRWRWPAFALVLAVLALALAVPVGVLGYWLVRGLAAGEALRGVGGSAVDSLTVSGLAAIAAAAAAIPLAVLGARHRGFPLTRPIEVVGHSGYALPGIVVALALVFASLRLGYLYQTLPLLVVGYAVLFLPQALGATRVALLQVSPSMEEAARGLGRRPLTAFTTITLPLAARGVIAGAALVFLTAMKELPAALVLSPAGFQPLSVRVWSASSEAFFTQAALPALVLVSLSALPLALIAVVRHDA